MTKAEDTDKRVQDASQSTETTKTFANPDGTWLTQAWSEPVQVKDDAGTWHDIDTTLHETPDGIEPKYAPSDLVLSDGSVDQPLAQLTEDGKDVSLDWPTDLPAPELDGNTATYKDVKPGQDLVVTASNIGFEYSLVLNHRPDPADGPVVLATPIDTDGGKLAETAAGGAIVTDGKDTVLSSPQPYMYDATQDPQGEPAASVPLDTNITETADGDPQLSIAANQNFLDNPATQYPVTIDPVMTNWDDGGDAFVETPSPLSGNQNDPQLRVGTYDGGTHKARSYMRFDNRPWTGSHIISGELVMFNSSSASCSGNDIQASQVTQYWAPGSISWANQPAAGANPVNIFPAYGSSGCPANYARWGITPIINSWNTGGPAYGIRLQAVNGTANASWRIYYSDNSGSAGSNPHINVSYNHPPNKPSGPVVAGSASYTPPGSSTSTTYVNSTTPQVSSMLSDPDSEAMSSLFVILDASSLAQVASCSVPSTPSGGTASCTPSPALTNGGTYVAQSVAGDGTENGPWTGLTGRFTVAQGKPVAPTITCLAYQNGTWTPSVPGGTTTCTIAAPSSGVAPSSWIDYSVDDGGQQHVAITTSSDPTAAKTTITVPAIQGWHTIRAYAETVAGDGSPAASYTFGFGTDATASSPGSRFVPITQTRVVDTRQGQGISTALSAGQTTQVRITGVAGVPTANATAVVLMVTAAAPSTDTALSVWATGSARPSDPVVSAPAGANTASQATVPIGPDGTVSFYNAAGTANVIVDVSGYYTTSGDPSAATFFALDQKRLVDSRSGVGTTASRWGAAETRSISVTGRGGLPPSGVTAIVANVQIINPSASTFLKVWGTGTMPSTSSVQGIQSANSATQVVTSVAADGTVNIYNFAGTADVLMDIEGYYVGPSTATGSGYIPLDAVNVGDTSASDATLGQFTNQSYRTVQVAGIKSVPLTNVNAVQLTVTVTRNGSAASGFVNVEPTPKQVRPAGPVPASAVSDIHVNASSVTTAVTTAVSDQGTIDLVFYGTGSISARVSVAGFFRGTTLPTAPANVLALAGDRGAVVSWDRPASDGRSQISSYRITATPGGDVTTVNGDSRSARIAGLDSATSYVFSVAAANDAGSGPASTPSSAITPSAVGPVLVTSPLYRDGASVKQLSAQTDASFSWIDPNAGTTTFDYSEDGATPVSVDASSKSLSWYPAAGSHTFRVRAVAAGTAGPWATDSFIVTPPTSASTPADLRALVGPSGNMVLSGLVRTNDGSGVVANFFVTDGSGKPIAGTPFSTVETEQSGQRVSASIDRSSLTTGQSIVWWMNSCVGSSTSCSSTETAHLQQVVPSAPAPAALVQASVPSTSIASKVLQRSCTSTCPAVPAGLPIGTQNGATYQDLLRFDIGAIPAHSRIVQATLHLHSSVQPAAALTVTADQLLAPWTSSSTAQDVDSANPVTTATAPVAAVASGADIDLTNLVGGWLSGVVENDGVRLGSSDGAATFADLSATASSDRPSLDVSYLPAAAPSQARTLSARPGDGGVALTWLEPSDSGSTGAISYSVKILNPDGSINSNITTSQQDAVINGLANGTTYTAVVAANGDGGMSSAATTTFTPTVVTDSTAMTDAARLFLQAQTTLRVGGADTSAQTRQGSTASASVSGILDASTPTIIAERGLTAQDDPLSSSMYSAPPRLLSALVIDNGDNTADVIAQVVTVFSAIDVSGNLGDQTETDQIILHFNRQSSQTPVLSSVDSDLNSTSVSDSTSTIDDSLDVPAGDRTAPPSGGAAPYNSNDRAALVRYALKHYNDPHDFNDNCTNFISKAFSGGLRAPNIGTPSRSQADRANPAQWWEAFFPNTAPYSGGLGNVQATYTWAGSANFHRFLNQFAGSYVVPLKDAVPGDIIFYTWHVGSTLHHHTAMVSARVRDGQGKPVSSDVYVVQSSADYQFRPLSLQKVHYKSIGVNDFNYTVVRVGRVP